MLIHLLILKHVHVACDVMKERTLYLLKPSSLIWHLMPYLFLFPLQIAFDLGHIIDNGETACYRAGRTNPNFEGKGYIKQLMVYLREACSNRGVKRGVFTVADTYPYLTNPSFRMVNTFIASKVDIIILIETVNTLYTRNPLKGTLAVKTQMKCSIMMHFIRVYTVS